MVTVVHVAVGAASALAVTQNYGFAFAVGLGSHFLLDWMEHVDNHTFYRSDKFMMIVTGAIDLVLAFSLLFIFLIKKKPLDAEIAVWGAVGGIIPDVLCEAVPSLAEFLSRFTFLRWVRPVRYIRFLPGLWQLHKFHLWIHTETPKSRTLWGITTQAVWLTGALVFLYWV